MHLYAALAFKRSIYMKIKEDPFVDLLDDFKRFVDRITAEANPSGIPINPPTASSETSSNLLTHTAPSSWTGDSAAASVSKTLVTSNLFAQLAEQGKDEEGRNKDHAPAEEATDDEILFECSVNLLIRAVRFTVNGSVSL